jgi:hypothetical protein
MNSGERIYSIDPGKHVLGVACWTGDALNWAELVETTSYRFPTRPDVLVVEKPKIYPGRAQKGRQRDLIDLAITVGRLEEQVLGAKIVRYEPYQWKGQVPKDETKRRVRAVLAPLELLSVALPKKKSLAHNVWDAIGIGLVYSGRCHKGLL